MLLRTAYFAAFAGAGLLLTSSACTKKSPEELAREQLAGAWQDAAGHSRLECLPDGTVRAELKTELDAPATINVQRTATTVNATLIGTVKLAARYQPAGATGVGFVIPVSVRDNHFTVEFANAAVSSSGLKLQSPGLLSTPAALSKGRAGAAAQGKVTPYGRTALESEGWYVGPESPSGIMVDDNVFVALGSMSGGVMDIAQGYTIQKLPETVEIPARLIARTGAASECLLVLKAQQPASVTALVVTQGGLRLVTSYSSKKVAYGVNASQEGSYVLRGIRLDEKAARPAGIGADDAIVWPSSCDVRFTPQFASYAGRTEAAR